MQIAKQKHPGGRPTLYNQELVDKARDYLLNYKDYGKNIPSIVRLAQVLDITKDRLYKWAKQDDKKEIKYILTKIVEAQEMELLENGLSGDYNSNITKLVLGKHGYHDKQDVNQTVTVSKIEREIIDITPQPPILTDKSGDSKA